MIFVLISLYCLVLYSNLFWSVLFYPIRSYFVTFSYLTIPYSALHYLPLHYITLHYMTLHSMALHYIAFHCVTLHYIRSHYTQSADPPRLYGGDLLAQRGSRAQGRRAHPWCKLAAFGYFQTSGALNMDPKSAAFYQHLKVRPESLGTFIWRA